ncbi:MAG TPA: zinc-ribbon domain-containing protein [Nitrososphaeraceae archaeon]|nr:zinc-ribbon domain-containing protein [Nitrososphaeraceae archaeon]
MSERNDLREKKLRGSGGYAFANITDEEQKKGNLGGPELFLAGVGRLNEDRFSKYYCNKCEKEYEGSPAISYENPNEELGEDVILIEKGEYKCSSCNNIIAQYRKFNTPATQTNVNTTNTSKQIGPSEDNRHDQPSSSIASQQQQQISPASSNISMSSTPPPKTHTFETKGGGFTSIQSLVGMPAYNSEAMLIGRVVEIGLRRLQGRNMQISIKIANENNEGNNNNQPIEVSWDNISKIGDIILVGRTEVIPTTNSETVAAVTNRSGSKCSSCGYQNQDDAIFCEECGNKLV